MSFTKSPTFWRNPVAIGISSPSGRGDTAPDNPLDNPLDEIDLLLPRIMAMPGITGIPDIPDITGILRICETRQPL